MGRRELFAPFFVRFSGLFCLAVDVVIVIIVVCIVVIITVVVFVIISSIIIPLLSFYHYFSKLFFFVENNYTNIRKNTERNGLNTQFVLPVC